MASYKARHDRYGRGSVDSFAPLYNYSPSTSASSISSLSSCEDGTYGLQPSSSTSSASSYFDSDPESEPEGHASIVPTAVTTQVHVHVHPGLTQRSPHATPKPSQSGFPGLIPVLRISPASTPGSSPVNTRTKSRRYARSHFSLPTFAEVVPRERRRDGLHTAFVALLFIVGAALFFGTILGLGDHIPDPAPTPTPGFASERSAVAEKPLSTGMDKGHHHIKLTHTGHHRVTVQNAEYDSDGISKQEWKEAGGDAAYNRWLERSASSEAKGHLDALLFARGDKHGSATALVEGSTGTLKSPSPSLHVHTPPWWLLKRQRWGISRNEVTDMDG